MDEIVRFSYTPTYLLYGKLPYDPPLKESEFYPPIDTARTNAYNNTLKFHQINKIRYDQHYQPSTFKVGDKVWLQTFYHPDNRKLMPPMSGPFTILKQISPVNYEIDKPQSNLGKTTMVIHSSKLRPYYSKEGFELKLTKRLYRRLITPKSPGIELENPVRGSESNGSKDRHSWSKSSPEKQETLIRPLA
ncbi:K02A2.6-like [Cordylochernes scorpioides]|uniref:K02A2.6-like n=1 Tax=Cordylochernes scorpioides TaxID=51811 RepID=A0ABY6LG85_9ARAC|nr:K02A2.6-like [Cordylochernes scorpioides]